MSIREMELQKTVERLMMATWYNAALTVPSAQLAQDPATPIPVEEQLPSACVSWSWSSSQRSGAVRFGKKKSAEKGTAENCVVRFVAEFNL